MPEMPSQFTEYAQQPRRDAGPSLGTICTQRLRKEVYRLPLRPGALRTGPGHVPPDPARPLSGQGVETALTPLLNGFKYLFYR